METEISPAATAARVSVVVIGYNDAEHIADAVLSALRQGPSVAEVVAVNDGSADATGEVLDRLARRHDRLRVHHRSENSGGCGTPRNDGLRDATAPYVMFLDSDDVLPPGAVDALLAAADRHGAQVVAGGCVRRELPQHRDTPWQRALFLEEAVYDSPARLPRLVRDTLCVNKLYDRAFLDRHGIRFPDGAYRYEDFVFTARVLAALPRIALVPDTVYVWHVRRTASRPSISLDRSGVEGWRARLAAHRLAVVTLQRAGLRRLAHAARVKFLDHDLRMYLRELGRRDEDHRAEWWRLTREHLATFDEADLLAARAPARWIARVIAAAEWPRDVERLTALAVRPARLLPPYARVDGRPVWAVDLPEVVIDRVDDKPLHRLPVTVDAEPELGVDVTSALGVGRPRLRLTLRVHELYGRLAGAGGPAVVDVELRHHDDGRLGLTRDAVLTPDEAPGVWRAEVLFDLDAPPTADAPATRNGTAPDVWDVRVRVRCGDGGSLYTAARAVGPGLRRTVAPGRHGLLLVQPYATAGGSLALRVARGPR
ncbi:glycosyltransferase family 2 protein, partial [Streptomyces lycii]